MNKKEKSLSDLIADTLYKECCNGKQCHAAGYRWMYKEDYERMLQDEERKSEN